MTRRKVLVLARMGLLSAASACGGEGDVLRAALPNAADGGGKPTALLVLADPSTLGEDANTVHHLSAAGFIVQLVRSEDLNDELLATPRIVLVSASARSEKLIGKLGDAPAPLLVQEGWLFGDLRLTGSLRGRDYDVFDGHDSVVMKDAHHPIAAGRTGTVKVTPLPETLNWGIPTSEAVVVATFATDPTRAAVFAFEAGSLLADGRQAPARRAGFFFRPELANEMTEDGWTIFDAAVAWLSTSP